MPERFDIYEMLFGDEDADVETDSPYQKIAYAIVGYPGAGKSVTGVILEEMLGGILIETGDIVRDSAAEHYGVAAENLSSEELGDYATMRRERDGGDWVAQDTLEQLYEHESFPECPGILVGMRDSEAPVLFRKHLDMFRVIWVHTTFDQRLERLQDRGRQDEGDFTREDLAKRDGRESMWGTSDLTYMADHKLINHGTLTDLRHQVKTIQVLND